MDQQFSLTQYLEQSAAEAQVAADEHYKALFDCFLATIPVYLHRTGDVAPSATRPPGFNAFHRIFTFGVVLGEKYAETFAVYTYGVRRKRWKLDYFNCLFSLNPFQSQSIASHDLPSAILTAKELWEMSQKNLSAAGRTMLPSGDGLVQ